MKKLLLFTALIFAFSQVKSQHTTPWFPYQGSTYAVGGNVTYQGHSVRDVAGTSDTVWLELSARRNYVYINRGVLGDSLNGTVTLALIDTTIAGRHYRTTNLWRDDELQIEYKTPSNSKRDTIQFAGLFNTGAAVGYIITPSDTVQHTHFLKFIFDGTKFFQPYTGK